MVAYSWLLAPGKTALIQHFPFEFRDIFNPK
jgi:hypothetical protein